MVKPYEAELYEHLYPYPIDYDEEKEITTDVLVLGGGIAGCWAAIAAAKKGLNVAIVEKTCTIRSGGGGTGPDHWFDALTNPASKVNPEEHTDARIDGLDGYGSGITLYIQARDSYDCLLEMEKMGVKVRDTEDEFKGARFRDEETKFLFPYDFENKFCMRVWGAGIKPALYRECKRLGVHIYDRVAATSLLTEGGRQGARVVGATGFNTRTGEFYVFKGKTTITCMSKPQRIWTFSQELTGFFAYLGPNTNAGNGHAMAWRAGAEFTNMEGSKNPTGGFAWQWNNQGRPDCAWEPCTMVDATGKEIPWVDRDGRILKTIDERCLPAAGQKFMLHASGAKASPPLPIGYEHSTPGFIKDLAERIKKGEYRLPLYTDLPSMPPIYRRVIWGLMIGNEGKTQIPVYHTLSQSGFDPDKDLLQFYGHPLSSRGELWGLPGGSGAPEWREMASANGGLLVDWDLKTSLEGLYAAGENVFSSGNHSKAACTGRWAGRHAADYARTAAEPVIDRNQVEAEKTRVYAAAKRKQSGGMDWKEFNSGICKIMQVYCPDPKGEELLKVGIKSLELIEESEGQIVYAREPHDLMRVLEAYDILTVGQMVLHASLARKASCEALKFHRLDYPELDPPEWARFVTIKLENEKVKISERPHGYWGDYRENYEAHYSPEEYSNIGGMR